MSNKSDEYGYVDARSTGLTGLQGTTSEDLQRAADILRLQRLTYALEYATQVIEGYQMELRNSNAPEHAGLPAALAEGKSPAEAGFCQGRTYANALQRIADLASGVYPVWPRDEKEREP